MNNFLKNMPEINSGMDGFENYYSKSGCRFIEQKHFIEMYIQIHLINIVFLEGSFVAKLQLTGNWNKVFG